MEKKEMERRLKKRILEYLLEMKKKIKKDIMEKKEKFEIIKYIMDCEMFSSSTTATADSSTDKSKAAEY